MHHHLYFLNYRKRMTRIELATPAWEAEVLPLNYIRNTLTIIHKNESYVSIFFKKSVIIILCKK